LKILMLSWEYPPKVVGGIARHVADLSKALVKMGGTEIHVLTCGVQGAPNQEIIDGVKVYRITSNNPVPPDFLTWVMQLNLNMIELASQLRRLGQDYDLIHSHDWLAAYAGKNLKHSWRVPLVSTIHATEHGRNNGLHNPLQRYISDIEWWLGYESWRVICCSQYMRNELLRIFQIPDDKLRIIPNGVYPDEFISLRADPAQVRQKYCAWDEKLILYVGRLVREKGLGVLLDAMPRVLQNEPKVKLVIAGQGGYLDELRHQAYQLGIYHKIFFTGFIDDSTRNALYKSADVAVFPSLYEPFGIVALEGMAAGAQVVAADTGGMSEIIQHGRNGLKAYRDNPVSLADNILWALQHPEHTVAMKEQARADIDQIYNWQRIALQTLDVYEEIINEYRSSEWNTVSRERSGRIETLERMAAFKEAATGLGRYDQVLKKEAYDESCNYGWRKRHQTEAFNL
jgi:glycogen(starch) synthase